MTGAAIGSVHGPNDAEAEAGLADEASALEYLASLSPIEYERIRKDEATRLGMRATILDQMVARLRAESREEPGEGLLDDPVPWPHPVNGAGLLDLIATTVRKHVVVPHAAPEALALWLMHCHAHDASTISPLLAVTSPTPECGKTTLLTLIGALVPRSLPASNITAAALFRGIEKWRPTLVIDEADTFLKDSDELRGVVNSGHNRTNAFVIRTSGDDHDPRTFSTWAPKAIALIGKLPPTLDSRSIHIELRRLAAGEAVEPLRGDRLQHLAPLCRMAWTWAQDHLGKLRAADPVLPTTLRGRTADNWRPLIAIADVAGGDWPAKARQAAETLSAGRNEQTVAVMLLDDIRSIFAEQGTERMSSTALVQRLGSMEDRPWPEWKAGKPISARQLAKLLSPFGVTPGKYRAPGATPGTRGYERSAFADAFARYLPQPANRCATAPQPSETATSGLEDPPRSGAPVADETDDIASKSAGCGAVADARGLNGPGRHIDHQMEFEERAAILEYDGGLTREEAEALALEDLANGVDTSSGPGPDGHRGHRGHRT